MQIINPNRQVITVTLKRVQFLFPHAGARLGERMALFKFEVI